MKKYIFIVLILIVNTARSQAKFEWETFIDSDDIFPSLLLINQNLGESEEKDKFEIGDENGTIGASIKVNKKNAKIKLQISCQDNFRLFEKSEIEGTISNPEEEYDFVPTLLLNEDVLLSIKQPKTTYLKYELFIDNELVDTKIEKVRVRTINDCLFGISAEGDYADYKENFAAYVNEEHPFIQTVLQAALKLNVINQFDGYQTSERDVYQQVYAIWRVLQEDGVRYSDITTTATTSEGIYSQHVRFLDESINYSQANCVDGTVLFASILRKIGIDPFLVLIPGHCFLGFYTNKNHDKYSCLETTMLGQVNLNAQENNNGFFDDLFGNNKRNDASYNSFISANSYGVKEFKQAQITSNGFKSYNSQYMIIDIEEARNEGILPINYKE